MYFFSNKKVIFVLSFELELIHIFNHCKCWHSTLDCLDGPIARLGVSQTSKEAIKFIDGRTMDALGSTIPTIAFLVGYSIFLLGNAYVTSEQSGGFELIKNTRLGCLFLKFADFVFEKLIKQSDPVLKLYLTPSSTNLNQFPRFLQATFHLIIFVSFLILSGVGWNFTLDYFTALTTMVSNSNFKIKSI